MAKVAKKAWNKKDDGPITKFKFRVERSTNESGLPFHVIDNSTNDRVASFVGDFSGWNATKERDRLNGPQQ